MEIFNEFSTINILVSNLKQKMILQNVKHYFLGKHQHLVTKVNYAYNSI